MAASVSSRPRVTVDGKFFRIGQEKFHVKGLTYGPFAPNAQGERYPAPEQARRDLAQIGELGANVLRVYHAPPRWFLDLAQEFNLRLLVDVPWGKYLCFLEGEALRQKAREAVLETARACAGHAAVFAVCVVNEIPADVVRWSGAIRMAEFIDELIDLVKSVDAEVLCTFANFPPTEFLAPHNVDFITFNVYLHNQKPFENYLARLQMLADTKPLILGECGVDSIREGEERKCEMLTWQIETAFRGGLAGTIIYSYTDEWFNDGRFVDEWQFGLTTKDRQPKESFHVVQRMFQVAPYFPLPYYPPVSVVIACYNGAITLKACLESLERLNYPQYEIILVDDGSTDDTPKIAAQFPKVRNIRLEKNQGLSVARNRGIEESLGEIVAFTDADCKADEDWLYYLVGDLINSRFTGIGGHNFLPPDDSWVASAVMVSPGGPAHVMLNDREAEHIPGCNMAFYKWALDEIGGFDPVYRRAGDDVDICWRLQQRGYRIGFSSAGFVWHYRRSNLRAYLRQQEGYGEAEALLVRKHPEYFNTIGGSIWHGRIYTPAKTGLVLRAPMIYHGSFGSAFFQSIYRPPDSMALMLLTSLEYHVLVTLPLLVLYSVVPWLLPMAVSSLVISLGFCVAAGLQADIPRRKKDFWSRPLVALLFLLQPIVRGWARYKGRLLLEHSPLSDRETLDTLDLKNKGKRFREVQYWSEKGGGRMEFLSRVLAELDNQGWQNKTDTGWSDHDVEIYGSRWCTLQLVSVGEMHPGGKQLIRCRLQTRWSLMGTVAFWSVMGIELLILGVGGKTWGGLAFVVASLVALAWLLHLEQSNLRRLISVFLDGVAKKQGLVKIDLEPEPPPPRPKPKAKADQPS